MGILILLSIANWLHLLATVIWIGGMVLFPFVIMPAASQALGSGPNLGKLMGTLVGKYKPWAYVSIGLFIVTGIPMLLLNENYAGLGNIDSLWTLLLAIKHVLVIVMIVIAVYTGEVVARRINRLMTGGGASEGPPPELARLQRLQLKQAKVNLVLGVIVLLLTGIATAVT